MLIRANSIGAILSLAVLGFILRDLNSWSRRKISRSAQPEKAGNKENDDDDADDVENVHGVLRRGVCDFSMKARALKRNVLVGKEVPLAAEAIRRRALDLSAGCCC